MIPARYSAAGFTLTELVVVIIITTILAAFAISRINTTSFHADGYAQEVAATLRYAQRIAISQRRNVAVVISGNTVSLTYPDVPPSGAAVREPPGTGEYSISPRASGVTLSGMASFTFSALGKPSAGGTLTVSGGDVSRTINVQAETGYVRIL